MKSRFIALAAVLFAIANIDGLHAQGTQHNKAEDSQKLPLKFRPITRPDSLASNRFPLGKINATVARNLEKDFKNIEGLNWYTADDGYAAMFYSNGNLTRVRYDKKWRLVGSFTQYGEMFLPRNVYNLLKGTYPDYEITTVSEVRAAGKVLYSVLMNNCSYLMRLKVMDGEMEVVERFLKK
jgi:hypothetical protein